MSVSDGVKALKELAALVDLKTLEAKDAERKCAGKDSSDETTDSEIDDLRSIYNGVAAYEQEAQLGATAKSNDEEKSIEQESKSAERPESSGIQAESIMDAIEAKLEFRAICSTCTWFLKIAAGNALPDLCCIENAALDFEGFVDLLESCKTIEDHRSKTSSTISPVLIEVLLTHKPTDTMHGEWPIPAFHRITHAQVAALAKAWGINPESEPRLLWIVLQALQTPLPPGWQVLHPLGSLHPLFRNVDTKEERDDHPGTSYFKELVQHERQQIEQLQRYSALDADLDPAMAWIHFTFPYKIKAEDGSQYRAQVSYYYNFAAGKGQGMAPTLEQGVVLSDENGLLHSKTSQSFHVRQNLEKGVFANKRTKPSKHGSKPETLCFKSWWNDGRARADKVVRRHIDIYFHVDSGNFQVIIEGAEKVYTLSHGVGRHGTLEAWDLFVGAKINILGRSTTLMQASSETVSWNESQAAELIAVRERLRKELRKYDCSMQRGALAKDCKALSRGGHNLRAYMIEIKMLGDNLAQYRPKVAQKIVQNTQIILLH
ncbi:Centrosomal protein of 164 kDa [Hondaea fermentalgiana]|uniref:Centrosomal protein of 164 kDa n=1 Tax=Hondaea fermentalgiana TaxID=2315210 RepID=A0A2R5G1L5_9STRA|nr:Centrosomal protein of 164 kDa [Hondaea fermentalgiana]|eukprot:GBG24882.1 Centrosomal protein of 164 kDa [Hondaea fermentalgiana]